MVTRADFHIVDESTVVLGGGLRALNMILALCSNDTGQILKLFRCDDSMHLPIYSVEGLFMQFFFCFSRSTKRYC